MKRTGVLLLALALCLLVGCFASAEGGPVGKSGAIAAYLDGDGHLYLTGKPDIVNKAPAGSIVSADAYRVLFLSPDAASGANDLYMIDLVSFQEELIAKDVHAAILTGEDTAYYVTNASRAQLTRVDLNTRSSSVAYTAQEPIDRLYLSAEGLVVQLVDQAGNLLYAKETGTFEPYASDMPRSGLLTDGNEVYLTDTGDLYFRNGFNFASEFLDGDVLAYTQLNDVIYYISHAGSAVRLMEYDPAAQSTDVVLTPGFPLENQLTASAGSLQVVDDGSDTMVYAGGIYDLKVKAIGGTGDVTYTWQIGLGNGESGWSSGWHTITQYLDNWADTYSFESEIPSSGGQAHLMNNLRMDTAFFEDNGEDKTSDWHEIQFRCVATDEAGNKGTSQEYHMYVYSYDAMKKRVNQENSFQMLGWRALSCAL